MVRCIVWCAVSSRAQNEPEKVSLPEQESEALRILFSDSAIVESDEDKPGVILDYAEDGSIIGMEILDASKHMSNPNGVEYAVVGVTSA